MNDTIVTELAWYKTAAVSKWLRDNNKGRQWLLEQSRAECNGLAVWAHWRPNTPIKGTANIIVPDVAAAIAADFIPTE